MARYRLRRGPLVAAVLLICVLIAFIGLDVESIRRLQRDVTERTENYVLDVSVAMANDIDNRMETSMELLQSLDNSLMQIDDYEEAELEAYLFRKASDLGFRGLAVVGKSGSVIASDETMRSAVLLPGVQRAFAGEGSVLFQTGGDAVYALPMERNDGVEAVLCGRRDRQSMQAVLKTESFHGAAQNCITTLSGEVLVLPENNTFQSVEEFFSDAAAEEIGDKIRTDTLAKRSGAITFMTGDGIRKTLAYNPLKRNDWILFTVVPYNVVSEDADRSMRRAVVAVSATVLLLILEAWGLFVAYRTHNRAMKKSLMTDELTGGNSNAAFQYQCSRALREAKPGESAIVIFDIQRFKLVSLQYDSAESDRVLRKIMRILDEAVRGVGFAARSYADVFYVYLNTGEPAEIRRIVGGIESRVENEVEQFGRTPSNGLRLVLQSGAYVVQDPSMSVVALQGRARLACYNRSAADGGACRFFDASMLEQLKLEQMLSNSFQSALRNREFQIYLQPKFRTADEKVGGAEALVRWQHPQEGMIAPDRYIPLFEKNGYVCELDFYVFEEVCRLIRRWMDEGRPLFPISVNVSRRHFDLADGFERYVEIARRYGIPGGMIELELTETIFLDDQSMDRVEAAIQAMHRAGFHCSLDDFGSGFTSIYMLTQLNVDALKLDKRLVGDWNNPRTPIFVELILNICKKIGIQTVAEGIEERDTLEFLKEKHCDLVQGYIYARPMPVSEFERWLEARS